MASSTGSSASAAVRAGVWTIFWAAVACFGVVMYARSTNWYANNKDFQDVRNDWVIPFPGDVPVLATETTLPNGTTVVKMIGKDVPLWTGANAWPTVIQWACVLTAGLSIVTLMALDAKRGMVAQPVSTSSGPFKSLYFNTRRVLFYQLPPHKLWSWWCGGITVLDFLLISAWMGLAIMYLYYGMTRAFAVYAKAYETGIMGDSHAMHMLAMGIAPAMGAAAGNHGGHGKTHGEGTGHAVASALNATMAGMDHSMSHSMDGASGMNHSMDGDMDHSMHGTDARTTTQGSGAASGSVSGGTTGGHGGHGDAASSNNGLDDSFAIARLDGASRIFGTVTRPLMLIMFFPVSRSSFLQWAFGTDFSTLIKYHRWMSWGTIWMVLAHSLGYMIEWGSQGTFAEELAWTTTMPKRNVVGLVSTIGACIIGLSSLKFIRTNYYQVFYRLHILGFLTFMIFGMMHYKGFVNWSIPGLVLYAMDRAFRYWQLASNWTHITPADVAVDGNTLTMSLKFKKSSTSATIKPGQHIYLRFAALTMLESHPFSIASVLQEETCTRALVHLRVGGDWTSQLLQKLQSGASLKVQVEGPYDTKIDHVRPECVVVMIAGGIGVTPILGLLREYAKMAAGNAAAVPHRVYFSWTSRYLSELRLLGSDLLSVTEALSTDKLMSTAGQSWLRTSLSYTGLEHEARLAKGLPFEDGAAAGVLKRVSSGSDSSESGRNSEAGSVTISMDRQSGDKKTSGASSAVLSLHPTRSTFVYAVCLVLTFLGGFAGLVAALYYDAYSQRTQAMPNYVAVGIVQFVTIAAGVILPVMMFLAIHHRLSRNISSIAHSIPSDNACIGSSLCVLPGYSLADASRNTSNVLQLQRGRADIRGLLRRIRECHPECVEITVLVGGPEAMYNTVRQVCNESLLDGKGPVCMVKRVAHHF